MAFRMTENVTSRQQTIGPQGRIDLLYNVWDDASIDVGEDDELVRAFVETQFLPFYGGLILQDYDLTPKGSGFWDVRAKYGKRAPLTGDATIQGKPSGGAGGGPPEWPPAPGPPPELQSFSFDTVGGTQHITQAFTETVFSRAGVTDPYFRLAINVNGDSVEGCDVYVRGLKFSMTYRLKKELVTLQYLRRLYAMSATVNEDTWKTFQRKEVLFLGASCQQRGVDDPELTYHFLGAENRWLVNGNALTIGEIENVEKAGHQFLWTRYEDSVSANQLIRKPRHCVVNDVYELSDFGKLGIGV